MRFVIINLPPLEIREEIEALRRPLNERFGALEALRYPPHVTLRTGLVCPDDKTHEAAEAFLNHAATLASVDVGTTGLFSSSYTGAAAEKGIVGWSVTGEGLHELHTKLLAFTDWAKGPQSFYQPHLTIAFDDITAAQAEHLHQELLRGPLAPEYRWRADHVALFHETPEGWVEWSRTALR